MRGFANGMFYVEFDEENPEEVWLNYGNELTGLKNVLVDLSRCTIERYYECEVDVNLSDYDGEEIEYWFNMTDRVGSYDESRAETLDVDITSPKILNEDFYWRGEGRYEDYLYFDIDIEEDNFDEAVLSYEYERRGRLYEREKRLCNRLRDGRCEDRERVSEDYNNLKLIIRDEAGNEVVRNIEFA
jgi:hypothetical protein